MVTDEFVSELFGDGRVQIIELGGAKAFRGWRRDGVGIGNGFRLLQPQRRRDIVGQSTGRGIVDLIEQVVELTAQIGHQGVDLSDGIDAGRRRRGGVRVGLLGIGHDDECGTSAGKA